MLTPEQVIQIKSQIAEQIKNFPEDKKNTARRQIESMNAEQLEDFLHQNNLMKSNEGEMQCVFCSIFSGDIASHKLGENRSAVAVLEINPISRGHTIIIPKEHKIFDSDDKLKKTISSLIRKTEKKLEKLKPKKIITSETSIFGHTIINLIPVYKNESLESERRKASPEELESVLRDLQKEDKVIKTKKPIKLKNEKLWIPKRIP